MVAESTLYYFLRGDWVGRTEIPRPLQRSAVTLRGFQLFVSLAWLSALCVTCGGLVTILSRRVDSALGFKNLENRVTLIYNDYC